ncbi:MAG TPA: helix-turn-helix transcriptional regulator [Pyrinomonadaceae bacterium]|jgi:transcriptional regulator with XRE-family HTH domain
MEKEELKRRRERLGLTQAEFAAAVGVTSTTVSRYETGQQSPIPKLIELALEALEARRIKELQSPIEK